MTEAEIAALEEAVRWGECLAYVQEDQNRIDDADSKHAKVALIRAIIERERNGGDVAKVVAWLREEVVARSGDGYILPLTYQRDPELADAIASGAYLEGGG